MNCANGTAILAGFGYTFFNEKLRDYSRPVGFDEFSGHVHDMQQPLVRQPGEGWQYGVSSIPCPYKPTAT